jgi:hypothetical protein
MRRNGGRPAHTCPAASAARCLRAAVRSSLSDTCACIKSQERARGYLRGLPCHRAVLPAAKQRGLRPARSGGSRTYDVCDAPRAPTPTGAHLNCATPLARQPTPTLSGSSSTATSIERLAMVITTPRARWPDCPAGRGRHAWAPMARESRRVTQAGSLVRARVRGAAAAGTCRALELHTVPELRCAQPCHGDNAALHGGHSAFLCGSSRGSGEGSSGSSLWEERRASAGAADPPSPGFPALISVSSASSDSPR